MPGSELGSCIPGDHWRRTFIAKAMRIQEKNWILPCFSHSNLACISKVVVDSKKKKQKVNFFADLLRIRLYI